ncbi:MAG: RHS repeat-associated core domain-containing protein, partial [Oscillatoria sp. PMC 1051.18]|nr:RHS repeat-associated core domain-containing protein [Oscillatoria sp. PMC 1050.18]MEC5029893.1 RHS repeat-associated core domain-containing protein [Oscillatoria sp. PMC 1051.18]
GQYYLRDRYYDAGVGRFTRRDVYEGRLEEPITLHKYFYGNGNPVSYIDPSGLYTLSQFAAVGSIIGTLSGAFVGGYIGYTNNGNKMGWPVFAYSVAGALTGLVLGAQVGSLIGSLSGATSGLGSGGALGTTTKMTSKVVQQMSRIISSRSLIYSSSGRLKGYSSIAFTAGVISGGAVGTFTPNEYNDEVSVTALSTYTGGNALIIGYRWFQQTILNTRPSVPGGAELASAYITGFNLGYFAAVGVHRTIEKLD